MRPLPPSKDSKVQKISQHRTTDILTIFGPSETLEFERPAPPLCLLLNPGSSSKRAYPLPRFTQGLCNYSDLPVSINPTHAKSPASSDGSTDGRGCDLGE